MNKFEERYKGYETVDLIKIINLSEDYQPDAVVAAKNELKKRGVSDIDIEDAKREPEIKKGKSRLEKVSNEKLKELGEIVISKKPSNQKILKSLIISFGIITIFSLVLQWDFIYFMFFSPAAEWDLTIVISFLPITFLIIGTLGLIYRKPIGWNTLVFLSANAIVNNLIFFFHSLFYVSDNSIFNGLIEVPSSASYLIKLLIYSFALYGLTKEVIRRFYFIKRKTMIIVIGLGAFVSIFFLIILTGLL